MDLNKASYATVIQFGDITQFQMKLKKAKIQLKVLSIILKIPEAC